jgi:hypothetical protein
MAGGELITLFLPANIAARFVLQIHELRDDILDFLRHSRFSNSDLLYPVNSYQSNTTTSTTRPMDPILRRSFTGLTDVSKMFHERLETYVHGRVLQSP